MRRFISPLLSILVLSGPIWAADAGNPKTFAPKQGDLWVMAGDSITAQRLHTNFIEAYYRTRFPNLNLQFRNSGIGGNTTGSVLARFGYDIADWKPAIVSIELGMNDVGAGEDPARYIEGMRQLVKKIREIPATPLLISSSPVNDGSTLEVWQSDRCRKIHPYTEALVKFAQEEGVAVVDQFHPLLQRWAGNKLRADLGRVVALEPALKSLGVDEKEAGVKELQAFMKAWKGSANARDLGGDPVHPGPIGQFTMAATILQKLGVEKDVSAATLSAEGKVISSSKCVISDVQSQGGVLKFTRLDEANPWPVPALARPALVVMPEIADLSVYKLAVSGLAAGNYQISMDGVVVSEASAADLAAGVNLSTVENGPFVTSSNEIYAAITTLQSTLNTQWREASKAKDAAKLAATNKEIEAMEAKLSALCKPKPIQFAVQKVK